jgi:hypothetical protein
MQAMDPSVRRVGGLVAAGAALVMWASVPAMAQVDISGDWDSQVNEDQPHRGPGAELGDYTGLPINAAAQQKATVWDASILSLPERMAQPHPPQYFMRGPGPNMRITKRIHPVTGALVAFTLEGPFGRDDRVIWMDGRPHPPEDAEHLWTGFSTGRVEGNQLIVTTTHMKYGVIQRNGVPASYKAVMTEHFIRHGDLLVSTTIIDDPTYLEEPFIRTQQWERSSNINPDQRWIFEIVEEAPDYVLGDIPHWPLGIRQDEYSRRHGIPYEATLGGAATIYPEYQAELERMMRENPVPRIEGR